MSFENIERCLENLHCLLGIQSRSAAGLGPRDHGLLSRHYTFPFGNVACCNSERTFVRRHSCEYITRHACFSVARLARPPLPAASIIGNVARERPPPLGRTRSERRWRYNPERCALTSPPSRPFSSEIVRMLALPNRLLKKVRSRMASRGSAVERMSKTGRIHMGRLRHASKR